MSDHHPMGPSSLILRAACPGSYSAELPVWDTPEEERDDAKLGTLRHAIAAEGLRDHASRVIRLSELDTDSQRVVESWWAFWDQRRQDAVSIESGGVEQRLVFSDGRFGTVDAWMLWRGPNGRVLTVGDLKWSPPGSARRNMQVADYAAALRAAYGDVDAVELVLVHRLDTDAAMLTAAEHDALVQRVAGVIKCAEDEHAPRVPGQHCWRCRVGETCEARRAVALQTTALDDPVGALCAMDPSARSELYDRINLALRVLGDANEKIKAGIRDGTLEVPGYRLIAQTRQDWAADVPREMILALAPDDDTRARLAPLCSPGQAKRLGVKIPEEWVTKAPAQSQVRRCNHG